MANQIGDNTPPNIKNLTSMQLNGGNMQHSGVNPLKNLSSADPGKTKPTKPPLGSVPLNAGRKM